MKKLIIIVTVNALVLLAAFRTGSSLNYEVPYPEGYRQWTHIKSTLSLPEDTALSFNRGFHHIYANEKAMQGYRTGNFPEGSVCVFDVLEAGLKNGTYSEGKRKRVDVMMRDSIKYAATGGWGYGQYWEEDKTVNRLDAAKSAGCFNCHAKVQDHVFSEFRN